IPEQKRNPVQLIVDEFEHFDSSVFEDFLAEARQYRLSLIVAHQTLTQTNPKFRSLVLNGVGVKMFFRTGREDGVLLSKDLTGDSKAIDFNNVRVGEAYLWKKEKGYEHVLVNAPLLRPSLVRTLCSFLVKDRMRREARAIFDVGPISDEAGAAPAPRSPSGPKPPKPTNLEDWL
ncbi:MAG: TraM recognition domain-containing protein, partial [Fimbriimonadaceae bacterium]|nr:TraM recognition domain-containing protein [Fimbriimonadaceae bacterium]